MLDLECELAGRATNAQSSPSGGSAFAEVDAVDAAIGPSDPQLITRDLPVAIQSHVFVQPSKASSTILEEGEVVEDIGPVIPLLPKSHEPGVFVGWKISCSCLLC